MTYTDVKLNFVSQAWRLASTLCGSSVRGGDWIER